MSITVPQDSRDAMNEVSVDVGSHGSGGGRTRLHFLVVDEGDAWSRRWNRYMGRAFDNFDLRWDVRASA